MTTPTPTPTRFALLAALALAATGCEDNLASIQIQAVCAPPDTCAFSGGCDQQYISWPTLDLDLSSTDALTLYLQVENQLQDNGDPDLGRVNTNDAHVDETVVEYEGVLLPKVIMGSNFLVQAGGTSVVKVTPIVGGAAVEDALTPFAGGEIVANLRMRGYYDDGTRFETGEFPITVRICAGCLGTGCGGAPTCPPNSEGQAPLTCMTP